MLNGDMGRIEGDLLGTLVVFTVVECRFYKNCMECLSDRGSERAFYVQILRHPNITSSQIIY